MISIAGIIVTIICIVYVSMVLYWLTGWHALLRRRLQPAQQQCFSIIIPFYNELEHIAVCLQSIVAVHYSRYNYEIILVNDGSTDGSEQLVERFMREHEDIDITLLFLPHVGKKKAVRSAVKQAKYDWILTTDADCEVPAEWMSIYNDYIEQNDCVMLCGSVSIKSQNTFMARLQQLETGAFMVAAAGSIAHGRALMCSAANMCYKKSMYESVHSYMEATLQYASGDDVFLLHACADKYGADSIGYVISPHAVVYTHAVSSLSGFLRQRSRWAGKTPHYSVRYPQYVAASVWLMSMLIVAAILLACIGMVKWSSVLWIFGAKFIADVPVMTAWCRHVKCKPLLWWYPVAAVCYPWYVAAVTVSMCLKCTDWH